MLLQDSRRDARTRPGGELVLLADQDRSLWDRAQIEEGVGLLRHQPPGPYVLQAMIAAQHARAAQPSDTDWARIADLYALLARVAPGPVVELNRAVAVAMAEGPDRGLDLIDRIHGLEGYHLLHSARGDLLTRLGRGEEAAASYRLALELTSQPAEREFLQRRLEASLAPLPPPHGDPS